jgi:hypothetical protein
MTLTVASLSTAAMEWSSGGARATWTRCNSLRTIAASVVGKPKRVTIFHGRYRADAEERAEIERGKFPDTNVTVSGEPGKWKVRRDLMPDENYEEVRYRGFHG